MKKRNKIILIILALIAVSIILPIVPTIKRTNVYQCFTSPCPGAWQTEVFFKTLPQLIK